MYSLEGPELNGDAFTGGEWLKLNNAVAEASQIHLGRAHRRHRGWATGETIEHAEQAHLVRVHQDLEANKEGNTKGPQSLLEVHCRRYQYLVVCGGTRKL